MNITLKVAAIIKNKIQQTLLIKEQYTEEKGYKWNLVKGTFDNPAETIEECVRREIQEEVGLTNFESIILKKVYHYGTTEQPKMLFVFAAKYLGGELSTTNNIKSDENIDEIKWFSKEELKEIKHEDCIDSYVYTSLQDIENERVDIKQI